MGQCQKKLGMFGYQLLVHIVNGIKHVFTIETFETELKYGPHWSSIKFDRTMPQCVLHII